MSPSRMSRRPKIGKNFFLFRRRLTQFVSGKRWKTNVPIGTCHGWGYFTFRHGDVRLLLGGERGRCFHYAAEFRLVPNT